MLYGSNHNSSLFAFEFFYEWFESWYLFIFLFLLIRFLFIYNSPVFSNSFNQEKSSSWKFSFLCSSCVNICFVLLVLPTCKILTWKFCDRAEGKVKHCRIKQGDELYLIGNSSFETLCAIIKFYRKNTLFRKIKLRHPATRELNEKLIKVSLVYCFCFLCIKFKLRWLWTHVNVIIKTNRKFYFFFIS